MTGPRAFIARLIHKSRSLRELTDDDSGVVGPVVAVMGVSLLAVAGLALDVGVYYSSNRELRAATEAAALAAASRPSSAQARAVEYLTSNGYDASVLKSVEVGYYCANDSLKAATNSGTRFVASGSFNGQPCAGSVKGVNAVRLTTGKKSRQFLTGVLGGASPIPELGATASAARIDEAGIAVTSGLLAVTNNLVNSVNDLLGTLLGIKLRLTTADIEALMGGDVDAGRFFDALARLSGKTGTYQKLVDGTYGMADIAEAASQAAYDPKTATVLHAFAGVVSNDYKVPISGMFGLGVWKNMPVGGTNVAPGLRAGLNSYQLLSYAAQSGPGEINLSNTVSLLVPGSKVIIKGVGTGLADRPRFAFGPAGETVVGTSMLRLQVDVQMLNVLGLVTTGVPLVVDVDAAQAQISHIDCADLSEQRTQTKVIVTAQSGLVNVYLGKLNKASALTKPVPPLSRADFDYAPILNVAGLVTLNAKAVVQPVVGAQPSSMTFAAMPAIASTATGLSKPIYFGGGKVVGNTLQVGSTISGLTRDLQVRACVTPLICLGADTSQVANVLNVIDLVGGVLSNTTDPLLDAVLAALGVELGHATVWVNGARCGVPVLI